MTTAHKSNLATAQIGGTYTITDINTQDEEMRKFLFTLGCYVGEKVTTVSKISDTYVVAIKDARYSIDSRLAEAIIV